MHDERDARGERVRATVHTRTHFVHSVIVAILD